MFSDGPCLRGRSLTQSPSVLPAVASDWILGLWRIAYNKVAANGTPRDGIDGNAPLPTNSGRPHTITNAR
jgi:hypothetical protein